MFGYISVDVDPFIFRFPTWFPIEGIKWYGLCYVVSFFAIQFFLKFYSKKQISCLSNEQNDALTIYFAVGAVIGGRLGYCLLYNLENFVHYPWIIFQVWNGGMSSHGGFFGAILGILWFARKSHQNPFLISDYLASIIPFCFMMGRVANFVNAELVGVETAMPWGVIFKGSDLIVRHPSQLYEAFFEGFLLLVLLQYFLWCRKLYKTPGLISALFLILYAIFRIGCEFFREPDAGLILGMTRGQFYSLFVLFAGVFLFGFVRNKKRLKEGR